MCVRAFTHGPLLTPTRAHDRLSIYAASILAVGFVCYLQDEKLAEFESYVHTKADFPMASSKIHGIYPIDAPRTEVSKLLGAPTLLQVNERILALMKKIKQTVCYPNPVSP